jgi:MFS family permease
MSVNIRLSVMMFLEYAIWGAWYVTVGNFMGANGMQSEIYWAYTVSPIASIVSPFFLGMIADRFFATEKVLGFLHIIGGIALFISPMVIGGAGGSAAWFIILLLIHMLCYMLKIVVDIELRILFSARVDDPDFSVVKVDLVLFVHEPHIVGLMAKGIA